MNIEKETSRQLNLIKKNTGEIISEKELFFKISKSLRTNIPLKIKTGFDPTAKDIHLGHVVLLKKLRLFQDLGHIVYFLVGDFTARIGDPSGKNELRPVLSESEIKSNAKTYTHQAFKILDRDKTKVVFNSKWFDRMKIEELIPILRSYTVARLLERDDFSERMKNHLPITTLEFLYPLLQGYDSVEIEADVELGGNDQKFNLIAGRHMQEYFGKHPQVVITLPLLVGLDGKDKMSKSSNNYIGIDEAPRDIYGKTMSLSDEMMYRYYDLLTEYDLGSIRSMHPKEAKEKLAHTFICWFYDKNTADKEQKEFEKVFSEKNLKESEFPEIKVRKGKLILSVLVDSKAVKSRNEMRRLISQGAVEFDGEKIISEKYSINKSGILRIGRKRFFKITVV